MDIRWAILMRDRAIKEIIYDAFPESQQQKVIDIVEAAFKTGDENWTKEWLPEFFGQDKAAEMIKRLDQEIV